MRALACVFMLCLALSGCSTLSQQSQPYRARGEQSTAMITGSLTYNPMASSSISIAIGGEVVAAGELSMTASGVANGSWKGKPVSADCMRVFGFYSSHTVRCTVVVDGELASTLTFNPYQ